MNMTNSTLYKVSPGPGYGCMVEVLSSLHAGKRVPSRVIVLENERDGDYIYLRVSP